MNRKQKERQRLLSKPGVTPALLREFNQLKRWHRQRLIDHQKLARLEQLWQLIYRSDYSADQKTLPEIRADWIADGTYSGDNAGIMRQLLGALPTSSMGYVPLELAHRLMAELWLRGVSKEQFMQDMGLSGPK